MNRKPIGNPTKPTELGPISDAIKALGKELRGKPGYYYEHVNGEIIWKNAYVVDMCPGGPSEYFEGPFVKRLWKVDDEQPTD